MTSAVVEQLVNPPSRPKAFLSYKTEEKATAGCVAKTLESIGVDPFLAHESINIGEKWKIEILTDLKRCEIFVILVDEGSSTSAWCQQEVGFVLGRGEEVVRFALQLDGTAPPAFLGDWQGEAIQRESCADSHIFLPELVGRVPRKILPRLVYRLATKDNSQGTIRTVMSHLRPYLSQLAPVEAQQVAAICAENHSLKSGVPDLNSRLFLRELLRHHGGELDPEVVDKLETALKKTYVSSLSAI